MAHRTVVSFRDSDGDMRDGAHGHAAPEGAITGGHPSAGTALAHPPVWADGPDTARLAPTGANSNSRADPRAGKGGYASKLEMSVSKDSAGEDYAQQRDAKVPKPVTTLAVRESSYIPYDLAKRTIDLMQHDMISMKDKHVKAVSDISAHFQRIEEESREYFLKFIKKLQNGTKQELQAYRSATKAAQAELKHVKDSTYDRMQFLEDRVVSLENELADYVKTQESSSQLSATKHAEVVAAVETEYKEQVATLTEQLANTKTKAKARLLEAEDKYGNLVTVRDESIMWLEADRRRLIAAVTELHAAKEHLCSAVEQLQEQAASSSSAQSKDSQDLARRLAVAEQSLAKQLQSINAATAAKNAAESKEKGANQLVQALQQELEDVKAAFASANATGSTANPQQALAAAQMEIAQLKASLAASARSHSSNSNGGGDPEVLAALTKERDSLAAQLAAAASARDNLKMQVAALRAASAEAELAHKIALAESQGAASTATKSLSPAPSMELLEAVKDAGFAARLKTLLEQAQSAIVSGEALWVDKKKRQVLELYEQQASDLAAKLPPNNSLAKFIQAALDEGHTRIAEGQPAKAAFVLKQSIEKFITESQALLEAAAHPSTAPVSVGESGDAASIAALKAELERVKAQNSKNFTDMAAATASTQMEVQVQVHKAGAGRMPDAALGAPGSDLAGTLARALVAEEQVQQLSTELESVRAELEAARSSGGAGDDDGGKEDEDDHKSEDENAASEPESDHEAAPTAASPAGGTAGKRTSATSKAATSAATAGATKPGAAASGKDAGKLKEQDKIIKDLRTKIRTLETAAKAGPKVAAPAAAVIDEKAMQAALEKRQAVLEKKWKKEKEDTDKDHAREVDSLTKKLTKSQGEVAEAQATIAAITAERDSIKKRIGSLAELEKEAEQLRVQAEDGRKNKVELDAANIRIAELDKLYKDEQILRKRYYNIIEDMKGKIRVFCRARPMSTSELDRGNYSVVTFPDEVTVDLDTGKGHKQFIYDQCFGASSTQDQVFSDTEMLIQSAYDGYNVAIFAYGQTGSGKTFTMVGSRDMPGITPRAVRKIFSLAESNSAVYETTIQAYMVELYLDNLIDLFWKVDNPRDRSEGPKLEVKKDEKGLVVIKGVALKDCSDASTALEFFDAGNSVRHVGSTAMNATSSRSHLIFALLINTFNKQTKKTTTGKISLIDLAGSERVGKTGASADRLKEAQSINKSLSALGNVISALSTNASFIPYRDNKLTQVMSDSLGGNAKTLMFVNMSPADYNAEETQSSLVYASRVKLITNSAEKMQESQEVARLKKIIMQLKSGVVPADIPDDSELAAPPPTERAPDADDDAANGAGADAEEQ